MIIKNPRPGATVAALAAAFLLAAARAHADWQPTMASRYVDR
jgi:hypothetical protein